VNKLRIGENMTQEQYNIGRKRYMNKEISHQAFYLNLAKKINININDIPVSIDILKESHDSYFNDIPLILWDRQDYIIRSKAYKSGIKAWSLSDTVCCLKAYARFLVSMEVEQKV
jgi:hypothetical protein